VAAAFHDTGAVSWPLAALTLLALASLHAGANLANDYYDHISGNDAINLSFATPFTGGSRFLQQGLATPREILVAALVSFALGGGLGAYLVWVAGWPILALGLVGAFVGFFYSAPPLKLGSRGLGELAVLLSFGVLPVLGACYVQAGAFSSSAALAGLVVGLLMTNVLWINQFQDEEADAAVGKRTWVVRLGRRTSARVHAVLFVLAYLCVAFGFARGLFPVWTALSFLSVPLALKATWVSARSYDQLGRLRSANAATIATHLATSLLLALGLALGR
jgi:1,4-dihydroxy-2-naphthoate octaprenyltransferase